MQTFLLRWALQNSLPRCFGLPSLAPRARRAAAGRAAERLRSRARGAAPPQLSGPSLRLPGSPRPFPGGAERSSTVSAALCRPGRPPVPGGAEPAAAPRNGGRDPKPFPGYRDKYANISLCCFSSLRLLFFVVVLKVANCQTTTTKKLLWIFRSCCFMENNSLGGGESSLRFGGSVCKSDVTWR